MGPAGADEVELPRETALIRAAAGAAGIAFLFFVQYGYTGMAAPDTRCACGEARNR